MIKICLRGKIVKSRLKRKNLEGFGNPKKIFCDPKKGHDP